MAGSLWKPWQIISAAPMNNLFLSPQAQSDLDDIRAYIAEELESPQAAQATVQKILKAIAALRAHASLGAPLSSIAPVESDYRFLLSGNYMVFYRALGVNVYVDRVLYGRRDYLRVLLGQS